MRCTDYVRIVRVPGPSATPLEGCLGVPSKGVAADPSDLCAFHLLVGIAQLSPACPEDGLFKRILRHSVRRQLKVALCLRGRRSQMQEGRRSFVVATA